MSAILQKRSTLSLDAVVFSSAGLMVLLLGSWVPDDRMMLAGIPLNTAFLTVCLLLTTAGTITSRTLRNVALVQIPLLCAGVTLFWSPDPAYGLDKFVALIVSGNVSFLLFNTVIERHGANVLLKQLLFYLCILLVLTLFYKLAFGFFDRQVRYFMNGPIIFARLMSIAAIIAFFVLTGRLKTFLVTVFVLSILFTT